MRWLPLLALPIACAPPVDTWRLEAPPDPRTLYAPHGEPGRFFTPWEVPPRGDLRALRWFLSRNAYDKSRAPRVPVVPNDGGSLAGSESSVSLTWVGHSTVAVHDGPDVFLTDPHFGRRALIPRRVAPPGIPVESVPEDAFAVVSHNHYDHLDEYTVEALPPGVEWFVPLGLAKWFRARGRERVVELDWWQSATRGRFTLTCLPSQHWSRRLGQRENSTLWCSWLIDSGEHRYYFAGDSAYFHGFAEFGRRFGPIDVAILPIGAYEPRWFMRGQHMDPAEAYQAFLDLDAKVLLPVHWGTFDLTDEPVDLPPRELERVVAERGGDRARVPILAVGERWLLPDAATGEAR